MFLPPSIDVSKIHTYDVAQRNAPERCVRVAALRWPTWTWAKLLLCKHGICHRYSKRLEGNDLDPGNLWKMDVSENRGICTPKSSIFFKRVIIEFPASNKKLGGGNSNISYFHPAKLGEDFHPIWLSHIFTWLGEQPPAIVTWRCGWAWPTRFATQQFQMWNSNSWAKLLRFV